MQVSRVRVRATGICQRGTVGRFRHSNKLESHVRLVQTLAKWKVYPMPVHGQGRPRLLRLMNKVIVP